MVKINYKFNILYILIKYYIFLIYLKIFKISNYSDYWIISERGHEAKDNGYFLFKYIVENHPEIKIKYIISSDSHDLKKIRKIGEYIKYGSKEHYIAFITAKVLISTHLMGFSPNMGLFNKLQKNGILKINGKLVSIKHGITKDFLPQLNPKDTKLDLLIAGAYPEYEFMLEKNGFDSNVLKYTGFARFDNLRKKKSNQILFMPTFRKWMYYMSDLEFIQSNYYKNVNDFINSDKLLELLNKYNLNFVFYPHYEFQKYLHLFKTNSSRIKIASIENYDVQDLLINSNILITDYSSVFFDFAYMEKPVIYYQFDYDEYRKKHYQEGYFSYKKNGFGPVLTKLDDVISIIEKNIVEKYKMEKEYIEKVNNFFPIRDKNNCKRIYNEIKKIIDRK